MAKRGYWGSSSSHLAGAGITGFLYNSRKPVEICSAIVGQKDIPERWRARRNVSGSGSTSKHLAKAVCAMLMGCIGQAYPGRKQKEALPYRRFP